MKKGILFIILSALCVAIGQLLWKIGINDNILYIIFGFILYGAGALLMVIAFRYGAVSVLQPFLSLSYAAATILGYFFLNETISIGKIIGIILIITGTIFLSKENGVK